MCQGNSVFFFIHETFLRDVTGGGDIEQIGYTAFRFVFFTDRYIVGYDDDRKKELSLYLSLYSHST